MAWSTPLTAVSNATLTAAQWNASVRDNLLETAVAKASQSGSYFAGTGLNAVAERIIASDTVATSETTTSATAVDLATIGPSVTVTSGARILLFMTAGISNNTVNAISTMYIDISGAHTSGVTTQQALRATSATASALTQASIALGIPVTAGSSTYTAKYAASTGTSTFVSRKLTVMPF